MPRTTRTPKPAYRPHIRVSDVHGVYLVESERFAGEYYTTDPILETCTCEAAKWGRATCKHRRLALQVWDAHRVMRLRARGMTEAAGVIPVAA